MSEQLLTLLKFSLLALLYLFLFRVVRAVWAELAPPAVDVAGVGEGRRGRRRGKVPPATAPTGAPPKARKAGKPPKAAKGTTLVVVAPAEAAGRSYPVPDEATIGRSPGCGIPIDDTYASQLHARVFRADGSLHVEDLGSTNGTFLNDRPVGGPQPVRRGDKLRIGGTVLELR